MKTYQHETIITDYLLKNNILRREQYIRTALANLIKKIPLEELEKVFDVDLIEAYKIGHEGLYSYPLPMIDKIKDLKQKGNNSLTISITIKDETT